MKIAIGTNNKAKMKAVEEVLTKLSVEQYTIYPINVSSDVADQPMSDEETRQGAINRAKKSRQAEKTHLGFGLEGGVKKVDNVMYLCNWAALATEQGKVYTAAGAQIPLPDAIAKRLEAGEELGPVMDDYVQQQNTREHSGAIGIFTNGLIDRKEMFVHILTLVVGQYLYYENK